MNIHAATMRRFGECNHYGPAVYQPGEFIDCSVIDGKLTVLVDCYAMTHPNPSDFDVDQWEAEKLILEQAPGANQRDAWYDAFRLARAFLNGFSIQCGDTDTPFDIATFLAEKRSGKSSDSIYVPIPLTPPDSNEERIRLGLSPKRHRVTAELSGSPKSEAMLPVVEPATQDAE